MKCSPHTPAAHLPTSMSPAFLHAVAACPVYHLGVDCSAFKYRRVRKAVLLLRACTVHEDRWRWRSRSAGSRRQLLSAIPASAARRSASVVKRPSGSLRSPGRRRGPARRGYAQFRYRAAGVVGFRSGAITGPSLAPTTHDTTPPSSVQHFSYHYARVTALMPLPFSFCF